MLMLTDQVQVETNLVDGTDVDLFETFSQSCLVHPFLHGIEIKSERLVFSCNRAPQIENLAKWILLEASQRDSLLVHLLDILVHSLTIVRQREQLWYLGATPDRQNFLSDVLTLASTRLILIIRRLVHQLTCNGLQITLEVPCFKAVCGNCDQVNLMVFKKLDQLLLVLLMLDLFLSLLHRSAIRRRQLVSIVLILALPWRQETHKVSRLHQLAILVHNGHSDDIVVCVDLVHDGTHDNIALTVFDNLIVT